MKPREVSEREYRALAREKKARPATVEERDDRSPFLPIRLCCPWCRSTLLKTMCVTCMGKGEDAETRMLAQCENCGRWIERPRTASEIWGEITTKLKDLQRGER